MLNMHQRWEKWEIGIPPGCPRATSMMAHIGTLLDPRTGARGMNVHLCNGPSTQDDQVDLPEEGEGENDIDGARGGRFETNLQLVQELKDAYARQFEAVM